MPVLKLRAGEPVGDGQVESHPLLGGVLGDRGQFADQFRRRVLVRVQHQDPVVPRFHVLQLPLLLLRERSVPGEVDDPRARFLCQLGSAVRAVGINNNYFVEITQRRQALHNSLFLVLRLDQNRDRYFIHVLPP